MRVYTVQLRPVPPGAEPDVVLVKEGFSWPAFLLPPVWLVWHRQWLGLAVYLAGAMLLGVLGTQLHAAGEIGLGFCYALLVGASANDWRRARLAARGYELHRVVIAGSLAEAERRYFHEHAAAAPAPSQPAAPARPPPRYRRAESAAPLAPWSP